MIRCKKALVLLVAVCPAFSRVTNAQTTGPLDACTLMLKADADAAFAPRVFGAGEKGIGDFAGTAKRPTVSTCTFTSPGATLKEIVTVGIIVRLAADDKSGVTIAGAKEGAVKLNATPVDVPGLGDAAYWVNLGSATRPVIQLNVFKGKRLWLAFGASGSNLGTDTALAGLTKVARATLGRL